MENDPGNANLIGRLTGFAMRRASRRGFIKWIGKGGLALAAGITVGTEFLWGTALASVPCSYYLPGCTGLCTCGTSFCRDPDSNLTQTCDGFCEGCGAPLKFYAYISYYWNGSKCVASQGCVQC